MNLMNRYKNYLKILNLFELDNQSIYLSFGFIESIKQNLNYFSFGFNSFTQQQVNEIIKLSSIILQNLGQVLPFNLEYLDLALMINDSSDLEVFLKNSQNTFIKKLIIKNIVQKRNEDILPYIKKYIMKEKRVKYLALKLELDKDLSLLKDEVKE